MAKPTKDKAQEVQEITTKNRHKTPETADMPNFDTIKERLTAIQMRLIAFRAWRDNGVGIEEELAEIMQLLETVRATDRSTAVIDQYQAFVAESAATMADLMDKPRLDIEDIEAAEQEIKANPAIMGAIPEGARLGESIRPTAGATPDAARQATIDNIQTVVGETVRNFTQMAVDMGKLLEKINQRAAEVISAFKQSPQWAEVNTLFTDLEQWINTNTQGEDISSTLFLADFIESIDELKPIIEEELRLLNGHKGVKSISFSDFLREREQEDGKPGKSLFDICVERAQEARANKENNPQFDLPVYAKDMPELPRLDSKIPHKYTMLNNPISNSLAGITSKRTGELVPVVNNGAIDLPVLNSGKKGEVTAYILITMEQESGVTMTGRPFTGYDNCVLNGVVTLLEAGNETITPEGIARAMAHKTDSESISPQQQGAITKSIEKMRRIHVYADLSEEMQKRKVTTADGKPVTQFVIDNFALIVDRVQVTAGGKRKTAYRITQEPPLLTYSKMTGRSKETGQLLTVKAELMDIKEISKGSVSTVSVPNTETRQQIKEYLLKRIEVMKYARRQKHGGQSNRILFDTLYRETGTESTNRSELKRTRDFVFQALDYWKAMGYINGYDIAKEGKKIRGLDIVF